MLQPSIVTVIGTGFLLLFLLDLLPLVGARGDSTCWMGQLQFETCCLPPPAGNAQCWEGAFTYARCCVSGVGRRSVDINEIEDISSLGGCELNIFQEFKAHAGAWYKEKQQNLILFRELDFMMGRFDNVFKSCAPAALTALMLRLEANYFEDDVTWSQLYAAYVEHHHLAVANGTLVQSHHKNGWPLVEGMKKINALRAVGQPQQLFAAAEKPREVVDVVVCYCGRDERIDWLRGFQVLPWRNKDRTISTQLYVALRFYHKCGADTDWERQVERQRLVEQWQQIFHSVEVRYVDDELRADDCSAYLSYIVDRYDDLPNFTVFLHADAPEHIPTIELLTDTVYAASRGYLPAEAGFIHLAHNYVRHDYRCATVGDCRPSDVFEFSQLWKKVFSSSISPSMVEGDLNSYCCVQFLVRRDRIRLRSKVFYERGLAYFGETADSYLALFPAGPIVWQRDVRGRTPCQLAMYIWHVMFGEAIQLPRRHLDPRLPFFVQMLNIEIEAVHEARTGIDGKQGTALQFVDAPSPDIAYQRLQTLFVDS